MHLCILHNRDHELLEDDPGREAREDVTRVAAALAEALEGDGHRVDLVGVGKDPFAFVDELRRRRPTLVVNLCESVAADARGEMAIPAILDLMGVPYTGSAALALGIALHKNKTKDLLRARGVSTPEHRLVSRVEDVVAVGLPFPLMVKPSREDASVGIEFDSVVHDPKGLGHAVGRVIDTFAQPAMVERYIAGREIYVPLLGNQPRRALPLSEISFGKAFDGRPKIVSYRAKWDANSPEFIDSPSGPCSLEPALEAKVIATATAAFDALECQDYGRVDIRLSPEGQPYVIDVNPNCDLHPEAGFAKAAAQAGIDYPQLARRLVEIALERIHGNSAHLTEGPRTTGRAARKDRDVYAARSGLRPRARRSRRPGQ